MMLVFIVADDASVALGALAFKLYTHGRAHGGVRGMRGKREEAAGGRVSGGAGE